MSEYYIGVGDKLRCAKTTGESDVHLCADAAVANPRPALPHHQLFQFAASSQRLPS